MNEESITPLGTTGPTSLPAKIKRGLSRLFGRGKDHAEAAPEIPPSPELRSRAAADIREYVEENDALFERASRFLQKAERLESDGTTSESVANRAERARREIHDGLSALRESFAASEGEEGKRAFDAELEAMRPEFKIS